MQQDRRANTTIPIVYESVEDGHPGHNLPLDSHLGHMSLTVSSRMDEVLTPGKRGLQTTVVEMVVWWKEEKPCWKTLPRLRRPPP